MMENFLKFFSFLAIILNVFSFHCNGSKVSISFFSLDYFFTWIRGKQSFVIFIMSDLVRIRFNKSFNFNLYRDLGQYRRQLLSERVPHALKNIWMMKVCLVMRGNYKKDWLQIRMQTTTTIMILRSIREYLDVQVLIFQ